MILPNRHRCTMMMIYELYCVARTLEVTIDDCHRDFIIILYYDKNSSFLKIKYFIA